MILFGTLIGLLSNSLLKCFFTGVGLCRAKIFDIICQTFDVHRGMAESSRQGQIS